MQQVSHKLDKEIEQSFYPLSSFSIALSLEQNVLIETSCNNNSNKNNNINNIINNSNNNNVKKIAIIIAIVKLIKILSVIRIS